MTSNILRQMTVPFRGTDLILIERLGEPCAALKPIVEGMGLDWEGQRQKIQKTQERWGAFITQVPSAQGSQDTLCLPLRKLAGWMMSIQPSRVKPEIRDRVIAFQRECDDALWAYWTQGAAVNPHAVAQDVGRVVCNALEQVGLKPPAEWTQDLAHKIEQTRGCSKGVYELVKNKVLPALERIEAKPIECLGDIKPKEALQLLNAIARVTKAPKALAASKRLFPALFGDGVSQPTLPGMEEAV